METNEPIDSGYEEPLSLSGSAAEDLRVTARWTTFLSILGFIGLGLLALGGLFVGTVVSKLGASNTLPFPTAVFSIIYFVIAAIYFFPVFYLYRFGDKIKKALRRNSQTELTSAFMNLKAHYRFIGILVIVLLGFYALAFLVFFLFGSLK